MDYSNLEIGMKIRNLEARYKAENEASRKNINQRENLTSDLTVNSLCSPQHGGSGRRPEQC